MQSYLSTITTKAYPIFSLILHLLIIFTYNNKSIGIGIGIGIGTQRKLSIGIGIGIGLFYGIGTSLIEIHEKNYLKEEVRGWS